mmetsp:Transcript_3624/g.10688  ORF Transcript_3624/g.10688 Transcript_3624/m.10688 type:complete len:486 (+) Transcript_3624:260-1717(+)
MRAKRKCTSDAERIATGISKMMCGKMLPARFTLQGERLAFLPSSGVQLSSKCCWNDKVACPRYCKNAVLRFETSLPDRSFLARYSVSCSKCYEPTESARHLFCSFCNEILTGHIASPGGKVSDHLVTIRHLFNEANALSEYLQCNATRVPSDLINSDQLAQYISNLEEWAQTIRFPSKGPAKREDFGLLIGQLTRHLETLRTLSSPNSSSGCRSDSKATGTLGFSKDSADESAPPEQANSWSRYGRDGDASRLLPSGTMEHRHGRPRSQSGAVARKRRATSTRPSSVSSLRPSTSMRLHVSMVDREFVRCISILDGDAKQNAVVQLALLENIFVISCLSTPSCRNICKLGCFCAWYFSLFAPLDNNFLCFSHFRTATPSATTLPNPRNARHTLPARSPLPLSIPLAPAARPGARGPRLVRALPPQLLRPPRRHGRPHAAPRRRAATSASGQARRPRWRRRLWRLPQGLLGPAPLPRPRPGCQRLG